MFLPGQVFPLPYQGPLEFEVDSYSPIRELSHVPEVAAYPTNSTVVDCAFDMFSVRCRESMLSFITSCNRTGISMEFVSPDSTSAADIHKVIVHSLLST